MCAEGQRDSKRNKVLALNEANPAIIPSIAYALLTRSDL